MLEARGKTHMRRALSSVLILLVLGFVFTALPSISKAAAPETDFIKMYKDFFQDLQGKKYQQVWDALTAASKQEIVKALVAAFAAEKKETTEAEMVDMLEKDTLGIRTQYLDNFRAALENVSFFKEMTTAKFAIKSSTKDRVVLTITSSNQPKDFQLVSEDGKWKINFLYDISH